MPCNAVPPEVMKIPLDSQRLPRITTALQVLISSLPLPLVPVMPPPQRVLRIWTLLLVWRLSGLTTLPSTLLPLMRARPHDVTDSDPDKRQWVLSNIPYAELPGATFGPHGL